MKDFVDLRRQSVVGNKQFSFWTTAGLPYGINFTNIILSYLNQQPVK